MSDELTQQEIMLLNSVAKYAERVTAEYRGEIVVVDLEASEHDTAGHCTIRGDFGSQYTHGGYAPITRLTVPVEKLNNIVMRDENGKEIQASQPWTIGDKPIFGSAEWFDELPEVKF